MTDELIRQTARKWTEIHNRLVRKAAGGKWLCASPYELSVGVNPHPPFENSRLLHMEVRSSPVTEGEIVEYLELITMPEPTYEN